LASQPSTDSIDTSNSGGAAAATALGLAAGALVFGAAWWLRRRYGF